MKLQIKFSTFIMAPTLAFEESSSSRIFSVTPLPELVMVKSSRDEVQLEKIHMKMIKPHFDGHQHLKEESNDNSTGPTQASEALNEEKHKNEGADNKHNHQKPEMSFKKFDSDDKTSPSETVTRIFLLMYFILGVLVLVLIVLTFITNISMLLLLSITIISFLMIVVLTNICVICYEE